MDIDAFTITDPFDEDYLIGLPRDVLVKIILRLKEEYENKQPDTSDPEPADLPVCGKCGYDHFDHECIE